MRNNFFRVTKCFWRVVYTYMYICVCATSWNVEPQNILRKQFQYYSETEITANVWSNTSNKKRKKHDR